MPKRKRDDDQNHQDEDPAQKIRKNRFRAKIDQGNKSIASALKLARGFERQKLGRRQKTAKNDPKELLRLKEEVIALKALDLGRTASRYLFKQLAKTNRIKESPIFVATYGAEPVVDAPNPGAEANVVGRLFNSNPIKEVMLGVMKGIMSCLGIETSPGLQSVKKIGKAKPLVRQKSTVKSEASGKDEFEGFSAEEDTANFHQNHLVNGADEVEESEGDEMAAHEDRLASDSATDSGSASLEIFHIPSQKPNGTDHHPAIAASVSSSPSPPPPPLRKTSVKASKPAPKPSGTTTFLPSLMMGGYYSGSDSDDFEDGYLESGKNALQQKQRKNRRGQRARQEIAEKKHGKNANHLKKGTAKEGKSRDAGWDARRGATGESSRGRNFGSRMGGRNNSKKPTGANSDAVVGRRDFGAGRGKTETKEKDGPLHPSWEAAKRRKEQSLATTQNFRGKKITFD